VRKCVRLPAPLREGEVVCPLPNVIIMDLAAVGRDHKGREAHCPGLLCTERHHPLVLTFQPLENQVVDNRGTPEPVHEVVHEVGG